MVTVKRTFTLPDDVSSDLDKNIPSKERSRFIAMTLREALKGLKREELLHVLNNMEPQKTDVSAQSEDVLRDMRDTRPQEILDNSRP